MLWVDWRQVGMGTGEIKREEMEIELIKKVITGIAAFGGCLETQE